MKKLLYLFTAILLFIIAAKAQPKWIPVNKEKAFVIENGFGIYNSKEVSLTNTDFLVRNRYQKIYGLPVKNGDHVHVEITSADLFKNPLLIIAEIPGNREWKIFKDTSSGDYAARYSFDTAFVSPGQFYLYVSTVKELQNSKFNIRLVYSSKENNELKDSSFCGRLQMVAEQTPYDYTGLIEGVKSERPGFINKIFLLSSNWQQPGARIYEDIFTDSRTYELIYAEGINYKTAKAKFDQLIEKIKACFPSWKVIKNEKDTYELQSIDSKKIFSIQNNHTVNSMYIVLLTCTGLKSAY